jgi:hypothetical protein
MGLWILQRSAFHFMQVSLEIERLYGFQGAIDVTYRIASVDVSGIWDNVFVHYSTISLLSGQVTAVISFQVIQHA